ncbi:MAG: hypothetical protein CL678_18500 [Bdellovibrionaceae bacterium]|nr:hypothetical protein [Pseudobdellovibrionaceae bacterium]
MKSYPWLNSYLRDSDLTRIRDAVKKAERGTSAELVPMIVRRSSTVGHVFPLIFLFLLSLYLYVHQECVDMLEWNVWILDSIALVMVGVFAFGLSRLHWFQRFLVTPGDQESQVEQRALSEFLKTQTNHTDGSTGVLLFISLLEKKAVVLADVAIDRKVEKGAWESVIASLTDGVRSKDLCGGICAALEKCGELLDASFPIQADDQNELSDELIIKE